MLSQDVLQLKWRHSWSVSLHAAIGLLQTARKGVESENIDLFGELSNFQDREDASGFF